MIYSHTYIPIKHKYVARTINIKQKVATTDIGNRCFYYIDFDQL